jgi:kumamolisin
MKLPISVSAFAGSARFALLFSVCAAVTIAAAEPRAVLRDSVRLSFLSAAARADDPVFQRSLSPSESNAQLEFEVSFRMRNLAELQARIGAGQLISPEEMETRYYPLPASYAAAEQWLVSQGFTITQRFPQRLSLFAQGRLAQIETAMQTRFGRVTARGRESSAALAAPSVPSRLAGMLVGIHGLQPEHQARKFSTSAPISHSTGMVPYFPQDLIAAYNAGSVAQTGTGQTIAIVIDALPNRADLDTFWVGCGVNQTQDRMQFISLASNLPAPQGEETLDAEWASSIAPGATVRVYATGSLSDSSLNRAYARIVQDAATIPGLRQVSLSYGADEVAYPSSYLRSQSQYFAAMASAGISVFVSSGDSGNRSYSNSNTVTVSYPASDPYVTSVGGTTLTLNTSATITSETVWNGSGGGISTVFAKPSWQTVSYAKRTVPDLCAAADPRTGALVVLNAKLYQYGGTSWSAPMMAGFCARINQARASAGLGPVGLFASKIYSLPSCFRDITSGSNGYSASYGYDLCTGMGSPNVASLLAALTGTSTPAPTQSAPTLTTQPASKTILSGQTATLSVVATSKTAMSYQWYQGASGDKTRPITTAKAASFTTPALTVSATYWVAVSNSTGTTSSSAATVTVSRPPSITGQPLSSSVAVGGKATFTVTATGIPAVSSYQWQRLAKGTTAWTSLASGAVYGGTTTASLTVSSATTSMSGDRFRCVVANGITPSATSAAAALTVTAAKESPPVTPVKVAPPSITGFTGVMASAGPAGVAIRFTITASGAGPITYQWYQGSSGDKTRPVANATAASYTTPSLTKSCTYWASLTNAGGTVNSPTATITVTAGK